MVHKQYTHDLGILPLVISYFLDWLLHSNYYQGGNCIHCNHTYDQRAFFSIFIIAYYLI